MKATGNENHYAGTQLYGQWHKPQSEQFQVENTNDVS